MDIGYFYCQADRNVTYFKNVVNIPDRNTLY